MKEHHGRYSCVVSSNLMSHKRSGNKKERKEGENEKTRSELIKPGYLGASYMQVSVKENILYHVVYIEIMHMQSANQNQQQHS
jgi:hypothetical protein